MVKRRKQYMEAFKQDAVKLVESSGKSKAQIARDLGVSESVLYRWISQYGQIKAREQNGEGQLALEQELRRLRRENETLRQERDILKKAISIFSQQQP